MTVDRKEGWDEGQDECMHPGDVSSKPAWQTGQQGQQGLCFSAGDE